VHGLTFDELMTELFTERWSSLKTQSGYAMCVRVMKRHIKTDYPAEVTKQQVLAWRAAVVKRPGRPEGISEVSWNTYSRHLKALYNFGIERGYVTENPFLRVNLKPPVLKTKTLPDGAISKIRQLLRYCMDLEQKGEPRGAYIHPAWFWLVVVEMLYHTGIRQRQLLCIKLHDIDLRNARFICSAEGAKNSKESLLPLHSELIPLLDHLLDQAVRRGAKPSDQLFNVNLHSKRHRLETMNTWQVGMFFTRLSRKLGMTISPHRFRHSFATELMAGDNADIHLTQLLMGHSDIRSTMIYVDVPVDKLRSYLMQRSGA